MRKIERIAFVGLGVMGGRMCRNVAEKSGAQVRGYDLDPAQAKALEESGIVAAPSLEEAVTGADLVLVCVPGEPQVRDLAFADGGLVSLARPGQVFVDMTTATPEVDRELAAALADRGAAFADAPVARGVPAAENGTLSIMVGAEPEVYAQIVEVLRCMGTDISHCGGVGTGQVMKLMNNLLVHVNVCAIAEAMAIATRAGVAREKVFEVLSSGSADSFVMRKHGVHMTDGSYPDDQFPVRYSLKDTRYALALAASVGVDADFGEAARSRLEAAIDQGFGDHYSPVVLRLHEDRDRG